jgi:hypothetical protein
MPSSILYFGYGAVMLVAYACFLKAYATRLDTPTHKRWGMAGTAISLTGILVVVVGAYAWGWRPDERWHEMVMVHRAIALVSFALLALTAVTGAKRHKLHPKLFRFFLPAYTLALITAAIGYQP